MQFVITLPFRRFTYPSLPRERNLEGGNVRSGKRLNLATIRRACQSRDHRSSLPPDKLTLATLPPSPVYIHPLIFVSKLRTCEYGSTDRIPAFQFETNYPSGKYRGWGIYF